MVQLGVQQALAFLAVDHLGTDLQRVNDIDAGIDVGVAVNGLVADLPRAGERLDQQFADFQFIVTGFVHGNSLFYIIYENSIAHFLQFGYRDFRGMSRK